MKQAELKGCRWLLQKNIDCNCFGKKCLRYRTITVTGILRVKVQFKAAKEFREFLYGNGIGKSLVTFEGNKMIHVHQGETR